VDGGEYRCKLNSQTSGVVKYMGNNKKVIAIKRAIAFIVDETFLFMPIYFLTMSIYAELAKREVFEPIKFISLVYVFTYPMPFITIPQFLIRWAREGFMAGHNEELWIYFVPILLKIITSTCLESSKWQANIGKKITKCYLENKDGTRVKPFKALMRNIIKYIFIIIFPPLILIRLHDVITKTQVILEKEN